MTAPTENSPAATDRTSASAALIAERARPAGGSTPRLLLIDGHSVAYRAFFALPVENFSTSTGQPTNAVYGFTSMLINVLRDEQPSHVAVAFDISRRSFRTERYAEYKAGRAETPTDFHGQVSLIGEVLAALQIPSVTKEDYEADDVIATLATQSAAAGFDVLICTGDRDAFQLISDRVTVLYPKKGVSELARMTPDAVTDKYGVPPGRYRDLAALVGETSDNLPGVPGVGPKTAAKWIGQYTSVEGIVAAADAIKGKAGESLRVHLPDVLRNHELNKLVDDLPLPVGPDDLAWHGWDRDQVAQVFDTLQFRVLRERLYSYLAAPEPEAEEGIEVAGTVLGTGAVADWLDTHSAAGVPVGVAVAGTFGRGTGTLSALSLAVTEGTAACHLDPTKLDEADDAALGAFLADETRPKVLHDAKPVLLACRAHGWQLNGVDTDTALAAYLVRPDQRSYDLADLAVRYLHRELRAEEPDNGQLTLDGLGEALGSQAAEQQLMLRAKATLDLAGALRAELVGQHEATGPESAGRGSDSAESTGAQPAATAGGQRGIELLTGLEQPLSRVLAGLEATGIAADTDYLSDLESHFAAEVKTAAQGAYDVVGREFNLGSPKQRQQLLFEELGLPKTKRTKTGYTTDAESLQSLYATSGHEVLPHLLRYADVSKLRSMVEGLLKSVSDDGRIHTTFKQTVAATGRLSSTDPNLQNIPIRSEEGRRLRRAFVVGTPYQELLTADYSQIEMRIMAHLSGDEALIEAFVTGADFHAATAARVFAVPPEQVSAEQRSKIKAMNYGLAYGLSAYGLSGQLGISAEEARGLMDEYFERFGGVRDYLRGLVDQARRDGYTETMLGRRRYLPDLNSDNRQRREMAERMALNAPIQGSAADIIKIAMLRVDARIAEAGLSSRMLLQVHDELVFEVADGERAALEELVRAEMGDARRLSVPLSVSVGIGADWSEAGH